MSSLRSLLRSGKMATISGVTLAVRVATIIVALASALCVLPVGAQEKSTSANDGAAQESWAEPSLSMSLTAYVWFTSLSGDVGVGGLPPADIDVDFSEIFKKIDWFPPPIMLAGEVRHDRIAFLGDFIYLGMEGDGVSHGVLPLTAEADLKTMILTFAGSYRVIQNETVDVDLLAGARVWMLDTNLTLTGPLAVRQRGASEAWIDPLVGMAGRIKLGGGFALRAEGDVGGFGVGADLDWQLLGTLQYQVDESITLQAGYRYLDVDYDNGGFLFDAALQGPIIGGSIHF